MIHTSRTVTVGKTESIINEPIVLYRGDREVEVEFAIVGSKFTFTNGGNVIQSTNATHGQLVVDTPTGENMFSEVTECHEGKVVFAITKEMIDELAEVGLYSFQIRLFDESQVSRVTIPPVYQGIEIRHPMAAEDETDLVDIGLVDYSVVRKNDYENFVTFLPNGDYNKTEWEEHDVISKDRLNKVEDALYEINKGTEGLYPTFQNQYDEFSTKVNKDVKVYKEEIEDEVEQFERDMTQAFGEFKIDYRDDMYDRMDVVENEIEQLDKEINDSLEQVYGVVGENINTITYNSNTMILYPFFESNNDGEQGVNMYISNDGYTLKKINNKPIISLRDSSMIYKNNQWLIAGTGYNPHDFVIYKSPDLVNWTRYNVSTGLYTGSKIWAPEWFENDNGDLYILVSYQVGETVDINGDSIPNFRPYIIKCSDINNLTFETPQQINLENSNKIDPCIIKKGEIYHMYIKDEHDKFIEHWTSPDLSKWTYIDDVIELGQNMEGPAIISINGVYYLYADMFAGDMGIIYYVTSADLVTWSERKMLKTGMERVRHGSPLIINDERAQLDLCKFIIANLAHDEKYIRTKGIVLTDLSDDGYIDDLEIIDGCIYSVSGSSNVTIRSVKNPNEANCFYLLIASNGTASISISDNNKVISVPSGYKYSAEAGDNDTLIPFLYNPVAKCFKPLVSSNEFAIGKKAMTKGCRGALTLTTGTIESLEIKDGYVYKVSGGNHVIINGISGDIYDGSHFYLILNTGGSGSITINSGSNITVPGGTFVMSKEQNLNDVLVEFIKVPSSTFRLRK